MAKKSNKTIGVPLDHAGIRKVDEVARKTDRASMNRAQAARYLLGLGYEAWRQGGKRHPLS